MSYELKLFSLRKLNFLIKNPKKMHLTAINSLKRGFNGHFVVIFAFFLILRITDCEKSLILQFLMDFFCFFRKKYLKKQKYINLTILKILNYKTSSKIFLITLENFSYKSYLSLCHKKIKNRKIHKYVYKI